MHEEKQTTVTSTDQSNPNVASTRQTVSRTSASGAVVAKRIIYYVAGVVIALIALRFVFLLLGANRGSGFVDFIYDLSAIFVSPFTGIFGEPTFGASFVETSSIVAIIIYALVALGVGKLLTLNRPVK